MKEWHRPRATCHLARSAHKPCVRVRGVFMGDDNANSNTLWTMTLQYSIVLLGVLYHSFSGYGAVGIYLSNTSGPGNEYLGAILVTYKKGDTT